MKTVADFPKLVAQWHPTKNGDLKPEDFTGGSNKKVWWKCSVADDHEWHASPNTRSHGCGCPCCTGQKVVSSNCLATTHPQIAAQWHATKNGDFTPFDVGVSSSKKVWWQCAISPDHEWKCSVNNRKYRGCPCCTGRKLVKSNSLAVVRPEVAREWHPTKNKLTPMDFTSGNSTKVWWQCLRGHEWQATISNRTTPIATGCPRCCESKGEKRVAEVLSAKGISYKQEHRFYSCRDKKPLPFDFVIRHRRIAAIEYQGAQHYVPYNFGNRKEAKVSLLKSVQCHDSIKREWCKERSVPLLEIPYWEFDNIENLITSFLQEVA